MAVNSTTLVRVIGAMTLVLCGCQDDGSSETGAEASTGPAETSSTTDAASATDPVATTDPQPMSTSTGGEEDADSQDADGGAECDIYAQDCPTGEKCVPYSDQADLVPDDLRCCPIQGNEELQPGDSCMVQDYFGSCLDNCGVGSFCLDIDNDGQGTCQGLCGGSAENPDCEVDETCFVYFKGTPMCFDNCDPLAQGCPEGQGCYPDAKAEGGTGFICLPSIGSNTFGDYCWLLSNCAPGYICVTPEYIPDCNSPVGCCTPLCEVTEEDNCSEFDPQLECVSWYLNGQTPPSVSLEDVGTCIIPP
jgi:hypothetical protein